MNESDESAPANNREAIPSGLIDDGVGGVIWLVGGAPSQSKSSQSTINQPILFAFTNGIPSKMNSFIFSSFIPVVCSSSLMIHPSIRHTHKTEQAKQQNELTDPK